MVHVPKTGLVARITLVDFFQVHLPTTNSANFRRLVLGCIKADFCVQIRIFQHFSSSTRFTNLRTAPHSKFSDFLQIFANFRKFSLNFRDFAKFAKICVFSSIFSRNFLGIAENPRKIPEIYKICRKFANFMKIRSKFPNFGTATTKNFGSCATTKFCS